MNPTFYGQPVALVVALIAATASLLVPFLAAFWAIRKLKHDLRKEVQGVKYTNILRIRSFGNFWPTQPTPRMQNQP